MFISQAATNSVARANGAIAWATSRAINTLNRVSSISSAQGQGSQYSFAATGEPVSQTARMTVKLCA